ncbi:MAG TPA: LytR C-terminal domain-containing protein [Gemmatimonadales bacterium]|nr:LytR C-terminal domain-containing protein [Gemmatimonadales bacterium]
MIVCAAALTACQNDQAGGRGNSLPIPGERGRHITVEVLNASGKPGLARVGTRVLRRAGIDVLMFGNAAEGTGALDSTRIVVRRGGTDLAKRVRAALGVGRVVVQLDSTRLLDASVFLGADFAPTGLEFHP